MRKNTNWLRSILIGIMLFAGQAGWADLNAAEAPAKPADKNAAQTLKAEDKDGLPVPDNYTDYSSESSAYFQSVTVNSPSPLKAVIEFYQKELKLLKWRALPITPGNTARKALLTYENDQKESLAVNLVRNPDGKTGISLAVRKDGEAKADGIAPPPGKARVYLGNMTEGPVVFMLGQKKYDIKKESTSGKSMKGVPFADLPPGKHAFTLTVKGQPAVKDTFEIGPDETWGLIAGPGGAMPIRLY